MKPQMSFKKMRENLSQVSKAVAALTEKDVLIGIPEDKSARKKAGDTGISNAYLGYIHEHGVPEKNIPARPALIPGIKDIQAEAKKLLKDAGKKALAGNGAAVETTLNKIGLLGQNAVRARFVNNDWEPLAESTLDARKKIGESVSKTGKVKVRYSKSRRERGEKKDENGNVVASARPLIDTSELRKSYTYVVRKKGKAVSIK